MKLKLDINFNFQNYCLDNQEENEGSKSQLYCGLNVLNQQKYLEKKLKQNELKQINYLLYGESLAPGKVGLTCFPDSENIIQTLKNYKEEHGCQTLVTLLDKEEMIFYGLEKLEEICIQEKLDWINFPIADNECPEDLVSFQQLIDLLTQQIKNKQNIIIHCHAGLGRTGLVAACILIQIGFEINQAIEQVRSIRRGSIPRKVQEKFIEKFYLHRKNTI